MFIHEYEYEYEYESKDKEFTNALNELMELIEDVAPHIHENEYLKGCNNLKILHNLRYKNEKKNVSQNTYSRLHLFFPPHPQLSLIFLTGMWILCFIIVFLFLLIVPKS